MTNLVELTTTKICKTCGKELSIHDFAKRIQNKDGVDASCKECNKAWRRNWLAKKAGVQIMKNAIDAMAMQTENLV